MSNIRFVVSIIETSNEEPRNAARLAGSLFNPQENDLQWIFNGWLTQIAIFTPRTEGNSAIEKENSK